MKPTKAMTYKELKNEVTTNRCEIRVANSKRKRELINRNHDLMVEMNSRWTNAELRRVSK